MMLNKTLTLISILLLSACVAEPTTDPQPAPLSAFERGKALYSKSIDGSIACSKCHGENGEGVLPIGTVLTNCSTRQPNRCASITALESYIDINMPTGDTGKCRGQCAADLAIYIGKQFNGLTETSLSCNDVGINKASSMRRLNKEELIYSINDIFGQGGDAFKSLPDEVEVLGGFATVGNRMSTQTEWTQNYVSSATEAADIIVDNGLFKTTCANNPATQCLAQAYANIGKRLFRKDLTQIEVDRIIAIHDDVRKRVGNDADALKAGLVALISSPKFLFVFPEDDRSRGRSLSSTELADRISLALTASLPDQQLLDIALRNELKGAVLDQQINRLVESQNFDRFVDYFVNPWIGLRGLGGNVKPEALGLSQQQWQDLVNDMTTESKTFVAHIFKNNLPLDELFTANYSFLNKRLADHYGIPFSGNNNNFVKTNLPAQSRRAGLLTHGAILTRGAQAEKASYVLRGKLVLEAFACDGLEVPDNLAEQVDEQKNGSDTEKEKRIARAGKPACATCHAKLDDIGWAFTGFGLGAQLIDTDPDGDVLDTSGTLFGSPFDDAIDVGKILVDENILTPCFSSKFLIHAIGRRVDYMSSREDKCAINNAIEQASNNGSVGAKDLLKSLLSSQIATYSGTNID